MMPYLLVIFTTVYPWSHTAITTQRLDSEEQCVAIGEHLKAEGWSGFKAYECLPLRVAP